MHILTLLRNEVIEKNQDTPHYDCQLSPEQIVKNSVFRAKNADCGNCKTEP